MSYLIHCEICRTQLALAEPIFRRRVVGRKVTLRCKKCDAGLEIDATALSAADFPAASGAERSDASRALPAAALVRTVHGDVGTARASMLHQQTLAGGLEGGARAPSRAFVGQASPGTAFPGLSPATMDARHASSIPASVPPPSSAAARRLARPAAAQGTVPATAGEPPVPGPHGVVPRRSPALPSTGLFRAEPRDATARREDSAKAEVAAFPSRTQSGVPDQTSNTHKATTAAFPSRTGTVLGIQARALPPPPQGAAAKPKLEPPRAELRHGPGSGPISPGNAARVAWRVPLPSPPPLPPESGWDDGCVRDELPTQPRISRAASPLTARPDPRGDADRPDDSDDRPTATHLDRVASPLLIEPPLPRPLCPPLAEPLPAATSPEASSSRGSPPPSPAASPPTGDIDVAWPPMPEPEMAIRHAITPPPEDREVTAPGYSLATNGVPSSRPVPAKPPAAPRRRPPRHRAVLWLTLATTSVASAAAFALVPRPRELILRAADALQDVASAPAVEPPGKDAKRDAPPAAPPADSSGTVGSESTVIASPADENARAVGTAGPRAPARNPTHAMSPNGPGANTPVPDGVDQELVAMRLRSVLRRAEKCHPFGRAVGTARVTVTFGANGKVSQATIQGEPLASAPVGSCVLAHAKSTLIPRFDGEPFQVTETVTLR